MAALKASNLPRGIGSCRCGKPRNHDGLCDGEQPAESVLFEKKEEDSPWHYMRNCLVGDYGEDIGNFLARRIGKLMRDKDCIDDFSVCEEPRGMVGRSAWNEHLKRLEHRCCGTVDESFHHYKTNRVFHVGFSYGH